MYLVTRANLEPGTQACQAAHAALDFAVTYPDLVGDWHASSNTLVILAVRDELELAWLCQDAESAGLRTVRFHEPDLAGALTAAAFEPAAARRLRALRALPLALSPSRPDRPRRHLVTDNGGR
ncbi:MAG TPA: peptidyl-tRNA hydrolase [Streptosporangiaceae bacterium]|nr:peptidyl-tRNA hydrolase [Streptosporangiaceae bacterium]